MARPLKQWLYKHRDNPYPTKTEKILLALGSQMTLVQVIGTHRAGSESLGAAEDQAPLVFVGSPCGENLMEPDALASAAEGDQVQSPVLGKVFLDFFSTLSLQYFNGTSWHLMLILFYWA
jgi:hypothetical protein